MKKIHILLLYCIIYVSVVGQVPTSIDSDSGSKNIADSSSFHIKPAEPVPNGPKGSVMGIVIDEKTRQPIIGATVICEKNLGGTITDIDGKYELQLPAGHYTLEFRFLGYDTTYQFVIIKPKEKQVQNIELKKTEQTLGLVTVTGSKYAKKFGEDVVSVEVLKPSFIEHSNDVNLDQALDKVPGVTMIGEQVNIRGGGGYSDGAASRVLILMDGLPLLTPDNGSIEFESLPLENTEQIEVIKGASSALYGSSALDGIINVITAWPKADETYNKITLFYGLYENPFSGVEKETYWDHKRPMFGGASFSHRKRYKNLDVVIGGAYDQDKGYLADDAVTRARLNIKLRYRPPKVPGLSFGIDGNFCITEGGYFFLWKGWGKTISDSVGKPGYIPPDSLAYIPSVSGTTRSTPINIDPFITYFDQDGNTHSFKGRIYYTNSYELDSPVSLGYQQSSSVMYYGEYNFNRNLKMIGVNLVAGLVGSYSAISGPTFGERDEKNGAVFLQLDKKFFDRLTISIGARAEIIHLDTLPTVVAPIVRSGINYQLTESTFLRASFGQGYRYPTIGEKFVSTIRSGIPVVPNPDLQPESGWSSELGIKQEVKVGKNWIGYFDLAGFVSQFHNLIEYDPDTTLLKEGELAFQAQNVDNARISGIDVSTLGQGKLFGYPFNFMVGYEYLVPIYLNPPAGTSNILQYRSRHSAKADIESTIKHVIIGVTAVYISVMQNISPYEEAINNIGDFRAANDHGSLVMDGRIGYSLSEATRVSFIAKNVLNNQYSLRPGYMEAPRNYTVQLSYQF